MAEAFVDVDQQAVAQAGDQHAVRRGVEGAGEFLLGDAQLLLGGLELVDVAHRHHQGRGGVELDVLGRDQAGEQLAVAAAEGHFQVVQVLLLHAVEQRRGDVGDGPDAQFAGGLADRLGGADAELLLEGVVDLEQAAVLAEGDDLDVRRMVEHRGELLFGQAQGAFGLLGLGDVDHQAAHQQAVAMLDQGDDVAQPDDPAVGGDHPVVEDMVAAGGAFADAVVDGLAGVVRVQGALPEAGLQPVGQRIAEQFFGVRRDVGEAVVGQAHFPGDGGQAFDQAAIVLLAAAQFQFEGRAAVDLAAQAAVDAQDDRQHGEYGEEDRQAVEQDVAPGVALIEFDSDPGLLQGGDFFGAEFAEQLVEDADQHRLRRRGGHRQLVAVGRLATDVQAFQLELAQAPDAGGEVADEGVGLLGGQRLQGGVDAGQR
ncbi:hypothetical protein D9M68_474010 [compost metagenome]